MKPRAATFRHDSKVYIVVKIILYRDEDEIVVSELRIYDKYNYYYYSYSVRSMDSSGGKVMRMQLTRMVRMTRKLKRGCTNM